MTLAPERVTTVRNPEARLPIERFFTKPETDPYDELAWDLRSAVIEGADGTPVFEQHDIEFPAAWSQNATNVVASKYFRGPLKATNLPPAVPSSASGL
jgi:ribonucleoside-diphosphate reductase alpha chain